MKVIAYIDPETGNLSLVHPTPDYLALCAADSKNFSLQKLAESAVPEGISFDILDASVIPTDRYFRDAWTLDGDKVNVDMEVAREIHMNKIREARDVAMDALDKKTLAGVNVQDEKQVLRDIPQTFDLSVAGTPEALAQLWPENLERA